MRPLCVCSPRGALLQRIPFQETDACSLLERFTRPSTLII